MFDTYAATIVIPAGRVADDFYLKQVREQVANPTGPVHIIGSPGNGKVGGLRYVLDEANIPMKVVFASLIDTFDIALTLPAPTADGKSVEHAPTSFASSIEEGSVLIIDEYDYRQPGVDEALLRLASHPAFRQVFVITNA
jgi:hypothetical protein